MSEIAEALVKKIQGLEKELEAEIESRKADFRYQVEKRRVIFEEDIVKRHRELKKRLWSYICHARPMVVITAPFIYALIVPFVVLDIFVTIYQMICFPVYGIARVRRADHIVFDRRHLSYLNGLERLNCAYCSYGNGLISLVREIASRTENYWCPIKHARHVAPSHSHYHRFLEYGDAEGYRTLRDKKRGG